MAPPSIQLLLRQMVMLQNMKAMNGTISLKTSAFMMSMRMALSTWHSLAVGAMINKILTWSEGRISKILVDWRFHIFRQVIPPTMCFVFLRAYLMERAAEAEF